MGCGSHCWQQAATLNGNQPQGFIGGRASAGGGTVSPKAKRKGAMGSTCVRPRPSRSENRTSHNVYPALLASACGGLTRTCAGCGGYQAMPTRRYPPGPHTEHNFNCSPWPPYTHLRFTSRLSTRPPTELERHMPRGVAFMRRAAAILIFLHPDSIILQVHIRCIMSCFLLDTSSSTVIPRTTNNL